jgi:glucoamylase
MKLGNSSVVALTTKSLCLLLLVATAAAHATTSSIKFLDIDSWIEFQTVKSRDTMLANISPEGAAPGAIIASPSRVNPNYYYHWIRDAGLVMEAVITLHERTTDPAEKAKLFSTILDFADFSRKNQLTPNRSDGLGEPKFNVDGSAYEEDWGRPQNDGPAIRANALIRVANHLLSSGNERLVRTKLYSAKLPADTVIKADLEYISHNWRNFSFDPWEESSGHHFYVRMVQRRALIQGARLAERLDDGGAAHWYRAQASALEREILRHWNERKGYILTTLDRNDGIDYKHSGLDVSVVLASLHGDAGDGFLSPSDDRMLATARRIQDAFRELYPINHSSAAPGVAIGRYPEDRYNGFFTDSIGNPWVLATAGYAEFYYKLHAALVADSNIRINSRTLPFYRSLRGAGVVAFRANETITAKDPRFAALLQLLFENGDSFLRVMQRHANPDGSLSEQINRFNGYMQGAHDLTWSYASFLTASWARPRKRQ